MYKHYYTVAVGRYSNRLQREIKEKKSQSNIYFKKQGRSNGLFVRSVHTSNKVLH